MVFQKNIGKLRILVPQLFRLIPIGVNPNLVMNTNEVEGLIADAAFFDHKCGIKT